MGDVKFRISIEGKMIVWMLCNCLHASEVPINLISVGALQEHHMSVMFSYQRTTIAFPISHPQLGGLSFDAEVVCWLSLLHLSYIPAPTKPPKIAYTSFQVVPNLFNLWH